jgi:peptide/nickel transport system permease protein
VPIGVTIGLLAGYLGGWTEYVLMRLTDVFLSIPPLVLAMSIMGVLEPTLTNGMLAVTAMWWPWYTRLVYNITRVGEGRGLCAGRRGHRRLALPRHVPRDPAQLRALDPDQDDARPRLRHPDRLLALLPRARRAAADARSRLDGRRRRDLPARFLVAHRLPRPCDPRAVFGFNLVGDALRELLGADQ